MDFRRKARKIRVASPRKECAVDEEIYAYLCAESEDSEDFEDASPTVPRLRVAGTFLGSASFDAVLQATRPSSPSPSEQIIWIPFARPRALADEEYQPTPAPQRIRRVPFFQPVVAVLPERSRRAASLAQDTCCTHGADNTKADSANGMEVRLMVGRDTASWIPQSDTRLSVKITSENADPCPVHGCLEGKQQRGEGTTRYDQDALRTRVASNDKQNKHWEVSINGSPRGKALFLPPVLNRTGQNEETPMTQSHVPLCREHMHAACSQGSGVHTHVVTSPSTQKFATPNADPKPCAAQDGTCLMCKADTVGKEKDQDQNIILAPRGTGRTTTLIVAVAILVLCLLVALLMLVVVWLRQDTGTAAALANAPRTIAIESMAATITDEETPIQPLIETDEPKTNDVKLWLKHRGNGTSLDNPAVDRTTPDDA